MAQSATPSLDQLQAEDRPAWLWDGMRGRIVWANSAGIAALGGDTLFDLIDRPFDTRDPDIVLIAELIGSLPPGEQTSAQLNFSSASGKLLSIACLCSIHSLPDGRAGLLVVSDRIHQIGDAADPGLMTEILGAMPIAIVVAGDAGQIVFWNTAAGEMIPRTNLNGLDGLFASPEEAASLVEHVMAARTISVLRQVPTNYGDRELRITARLLESEAHPDSINVLLMLEDVTDRRALERALSEAQTSPVPVIDPQSGTEVSKVAAPEKPEPLQREPRSSEPQDTGKQLAAISQAISKEIGANDAPATRNREPEPETDALPAVPELVSKTLNRLDDAIILHRDHTFYFANRAAMNLLGYKQPTALAARLDLFDQLQQPAGSRTSLSIADAEGATKNVDVSTGKFPWHDGPLVQSTLRPVTCTPAGSERPATEVASGRPPDSRPPPLPPTRERTRSSRLDETSAPMRPGDKERTPALPSEGQNDPELQAIIDTATDGIVTMDNRGAILNLSAGAEALFGYRLAEVAGKPFADLLAKDSRATLKDYLAALTDGGIASVFNDGREVTGVVSQGGEIALFMTIARIGSAGGTVYCAVLRDITQWKKTEAQLRHDKEAAELSSAQKSEFLARISHELRTPLNAILGFSDVMRSERFGEIANEKYLGYANDIHKSGHHLLSLINDLLDLSKIEAGKLELNFTSVDLRAVCDDCFDIMQELATSARVVLRKSLPPDLPNVVADLRSIKQILLNLLSNAIKFTDPGGQTIVSANVSKSGELKLKIKDTGIGMSQSELESAMQPFRRIEVPDRVERLGTGLGLPLTRALTEANRAQFKISSERKKGTLVEITFPTTRVLAD